MKVNELLKDITARAGSLKDSVLKATQTVTNAIAELREQIGDVRRRRDQVRDSLVPDEDLDQRDSLTVGRSGDYWRHNYGRGHFSINARPERVEDPFTLNQEITWAMLCALHPQIATEMLQSLRTLRVDPAGLPLSKRPPLIEQLERELAELEQAEETAVDDACAAGVQIQHRPEVIERRDQEQRAEQVRQAQLTAAQQRQEHVAKRYGGPRCGESQYLKTGRVPS